MERYRPGSNAEHQARRVVRDAYPNAASSYCADGAVICDDATGEVLGTASAGDWAVEYAWLDASSRVQQRASRALA